ncbi:MAG: ABC transporter ATP-binding protein [Chloroflexota bacterium]
MAQLNSVLENEDSALGRVRNLEVMRRLPRYIARVKWLFTLGIAGMVLGIVASLAPPYLVALAVDHFIQSRDTEGLNLILALFVGAAVLTWAGQYLETRCLNFAGDAILLNLRAEMFDHLQKLSLGFFDRTRVGRIMSRVQSDVEQLQELVTGGFLTIFVSALTIIVIAVIMVIMNARLALLPLTVVPALGIAIFLWQRQAQPAFVRVRDAIAAVNTLLQEGISGVRVTQSLSRERVNLAQFDSVNRTHFNANVEAAKMSNIMVPLEDIVSAAAMGLVIIFGGFQVLSGQIGIGVLLAFLLYIQRFFGPIQEFVMEYAELQRSLVAGARIFELLDIEPEIKDAANAVALPPVKGEIIFDQVSFGYHPGMEVLHNINLKIAAGENVAIVGRTGAGKSSLVNLIARFYEVSRGKITIDGYDISTVTQESLRRQMGIVPQDPFLFSGTIAANIRYGQVKASQDEVIRAAKAAGAHDFVSRLKSGYNTPVGERGGNLSAGERQLICLARAILANPPILILDEATSNVDTRTERLMRESISRQARGRTCLTIAHRLSTVVNADRIIVLERGEIAEMGTHRELMARHGLYYQMYEVLMQPGEVG